MSDDRVEVVKASGCVVWRSVGTADGSAENGIEVLVAHRPRYDDWSFPKGKLDPGETDLECAIREVAEETGLTGPTGPELEPARYTDHRGRDKIVRYWTMEVTNGSFVANDEVDEIRWVRPENATRLLSYDHDVALLDQLARALGDG